MTGSTPDAEVSSAINKVAKSLYNLVSKKKNRNKGQDWILEKEKDFLESLKFDAREPSVEALKKESCLNECIGIYSWGEPGNLILSFRQENKLWLFASHDNHSGEEAI